MKSNIDLLNSFANKTSRKIHSEEVQLPINMVGRKSLPKHRREVSIQDNENPNLFFILYGDYYKSRGDYTYHSGVYTALDAYQTERLKIRKKDILDKLNPSFYKKAIRSGSGNFDRNFAIKGHGDSFISKHLSNYLLQEKIKIGLNTKTFCVFGLNETNLSFETHFDEKSGFGILNHQAWVLDEIIIEQWFDVMRNIDKILNPK
ncbi:MAG: hypothetical protein U9N51_01240 [Bacteroidota bacterium]|nr:hypothetical protein [Bacteroidota bacterium]